VAPEVFCRDFFPKYHISHVILYNVDPLSLAASHLLLLDPEHWKLAQMDGRTNVFLWNAKAETRRIKPISMKTLAFGKDPVRAPTEGIDRGPQVPALWARYLHGPPARPQATDSAQAYLNYFRDTSPVWQQPYAFVGRAGLWASAFVPGTVGPAGLDAVLRTNLLANNVAVLLSSENGSPAATLLAIRAARQAIAASPDAADQYFALGQGYLLIEQYQEGPWGLRDTRTSPPSPRKKVRRLQLVSALEDYLTLRPDDTDAHLMLFQAYYEMRYSDLALDHLRASLDSARAAGPRGETQEEYQKRIEQQEKDVKRLEGPVQETYNKFIVASGSMPLLQKAQTALQRGLAKEALRILRDADMSQFGPQEIALLAELLLNTGQGEQLREVMPEVQQALGASYDWLGTEMEACAGNYTAAGEHLDRAIAGLESASLLYMMRPVRSQAFAGAPAYVTVPEMINALQLLSTAAEYRVLRGVLALEAGDNTRAERNFRQALATIDAYNLDVEGRPIAARDLHLLQSGR
jgi:tetratricopeptide (TPR) repeat protein